MTKRLSEEEVIKRAEEVHNGFYIYTEFDYINNHTKAKIICPEHGPFWQRPKDHLRGNKCPLCRGNLVSKIDFDTFVLRASEIHGQYKYDKFIYRGYKIKGIITCLIHGDFEQTPAHHLSGHRCPLCSIDRRRLGEEKFVAKARMLYGDKYDYSRVIYKNNSTKVIIICHKHGPFEQRPKDHLKGNGCPNCSSHISLEEVEFAEFLKKNNNSKYEIIPQQDKQYKTIVAKIHLRVGRYYRPDILLKHGKIVKIVEYDGDFWHGDPASNAIHPITGKSLKSIAKQGEKKIQDYLSAGFNTYNIPSHEWDEYKKNGQIGINMAKLFSTLNIE